MNITRLRTTLTKIIVVFLVVVILYGLSAWLLSSQIDTSRLLAVERWLTASKLWFGLVRWSLYGLILSLWLPLVAWRSGQKPLSALTCQQAQATRRRLLFWLIFIEILIIFV